MRVGVLTLTVAFSTFAPRASAQEATTVVVARSYDYVPIPGRPGLERRDLLVGLVLGTDGTWAACRELDGIADEGVFRARVDTAPWRHRYAAPPATHGLCTLHELSPAAIDAVPVIAATPAARVGPHLLGGAASELAARLGRSVPDSNDARTIVVDGPYRIATLNGQVVVVAAFLDELPGLALQGAPTIASDAIFDDVARAIPHRRRRALGNASALQPELSARDANALARSPVALGHYVGAVGIADRVLVFVTAPLHESTLMARLRSIVVHDAIMR